MKKSFLNIFGKLSGAKKAVVPPAPKDNPATIQEGSENDVRRHLVLVQMRDIMRRHGIPAQWIDCQVMPVASRRRGSGMYLRLVVKHWDIRLMHYASAFQNELLAAIRKFEPQSAKWLHGISWQLEFDGSCPYTVLPGANFWQEAKTATPAESGSKPERMPQQEPQQPHRQGPSRVEPVNKEELERLFAIRDEALGSQSDADEGKATYEKTQPAPL